MSKPQHIVRSVGDRSVPIPVFHESRAVTPPCDPIVCFSHLRWDFVYQRPQHLMSRFAQSRPVFFVEEHIYGSEEPHFQFVPRKAGAAEVYVITPHLPYALSSHDEETLLRCMLDQFFFEVGLDRVIGWYYTPMAIAWTEHFRYSTVVYDCMDELSLFRYAPKALIERERILMERADLVFTGGASLYEAKRSRHASVHLFPSSVDVKHFCPARTGKNIPPDQRDIPAPRLGFFGVIDERMDTELLQAIATSRPDWHIIMIGPVVKIEETQLPQASNIHYLGQKAYDDLPSYIAGWDVALLPFALNDSTRFISPTKTPEYMAAGRPIVATPIRDIVRPYGDAGLVHIADTADAFILGVEKVLSMSMEERIAWLHRVDGFLSTTSWDRTWARMETLIATTVRDTLTRDTFSDPEPDLYLELAPHPQADYGASRGV